MSLKLLSILEIHAITKTLNHILDDESNLVLHNFCCFFVTFSGAISTQVEHLKAACNAKPEIPELEGRGFSETRGSGVMLQFSPHKQA